MSKFRTVHINEQEWRYKVSDYTIVILSPSRKKTITSIAELYNISGWEAERGMWKCSIHVLPSEIKEWIQNHLIT